MKDRLLAFLVPRLASILMRILHATLRVRHLNSRNMTEINDAGGRYLLAFWHCHILLMIFSRHRKPITVMISRHKDGEYIASTMRRFGVGASRGSSSKGGGEALDQMLDLCVRGWNIAITPDGPRGPARVAQVGVVLAARRSAVPIVPVAVIAERKKQLASWDRFEIPHPFSRVMYVYGEPIVVPADLPDSEIESWRVRVETQMRRMCDETEARFSELWPTADR